MTASPLVPSLAPSLLPSRAPSLAPPLTIAMVGTGYVGLVSGACFAALGHHVTCVDVDVSKINGLREGGIPIYEPGLEGMIPRLCEVGQLEFSDSLATILHTADMIFLAVGTPTLPETNGVDLRYIFEAVTQIATLATLTKRTSLVLVIKSTVPVGTAKKVQEIFRRLAPAIALDVLSNPEFLREGKAVQDFMEPDRIVIGYEEEAEERVAPLIARLYAHHHAASIPILLMSNHSAELLKYASNGFLATKIAFINEICNLCEATDSNIDDVVQGMGLDARIGANYLQPGPGFGGSCFPKDTLGLLDIARQYGVRIHVTNAVVDANKERSRYIFDKIRGVLGKIVGRTIAIWGLTFKADTDDVRDSPSIDLINRLREWDIHLRLYDPQGMENARARLQDSSFFTYHDTALAAAKGADAVILFTEWSEFAGVDLAALRRTLRDPLVIDLRNLFNPDTMEEYGFQYYSLGRPAIM